MSWQPFERLVGEGFRLNRYRVVETGGGGADGGMDPAMNQGGEEATSLAEMDAAIVAIRKQPAGFEEIQTSALTAVNGGEKIPKRAGLIPPLACRGTRCGSRQQAVSATLPSDREMFGTCPKSWEMGNAP